MSTPAAGPGAAVGAESGDDSGAPQSLAPVHTEERIPVAPQGAQGATGGDGPAAGAACAGLAEAGMAQTPAAAAGQPPTPPSAERGAPLRASDVQMSTTTTPSGVCVAVVGCTHGELDLMYEAVELLRTERGVTVDLVLCCGDFQAARNWGDMESMAVPNKYKMIRTFYKYYSSEKVAPVLTLFVGGNHEASNYMLELFHGGWVAPNIYFMGYAGVFSFAGLRIGGLTGIFKESDFGKGHYEHPPYDSSSLRSAYHVREYEIFRLMQLANSTATKPMDVFLSHDWPQDISLHGNTQELLRRKPYFTQEVYNHTLGSRPSLGLLHALRPNFWFAAHLHVKFAAVFHHPEPGVLTRFLALDKCLPNKDFMQVLTFPDANREDMHLRYDEEWLAVVKSTMPFLPLSRSPAVLPNRHMAYNGRVSFAPTPEEISWIKEQFPDTRVPHNFERTAPVYKAEEKAAKQVQLWENPQTTALLAKLQVPDLIAQHFLHGKPLQAPPALQPKHHVPKMVANVPSNPDEIDLDDDDDDDDDGDGDDDIDDDDDDAGDHDDGGDVDEDEGDQGEHDRGTSRQPSSLLQSLPPPSSSKSVSNPDEIDIDNDDDDDDDDDEVMEE